MGGVVRRSAITGTAVLVLSGLWGSVGAGATDVYNVTTQQTLINQDRASNGGLPALAWDNCLAGIALQNAQRIAAQGYLSHTNGVDLDLNCLPGATQAGENIGYTSQGTDDAVMNTAFMNSPGHRANILGPYNYVATAWVLAPNGYGYMAEEFLAAPGAGSTITGLYTLDGYGGIHAAGGSTPFSPSAYWSGWRIARGAVVLADGSGGYTLDGYGGLHPFGAAPALSGAAYWSGWDIARDVALLPGSSASSAKGYTLDGYGGLHPFGGAPAARAAAYFSGSDIARRVAILSDGTGGYVMTAYGGVTPFAVGSNAMPPAVSNGPAWPGWNIARGIALSPGSTASNVSGVLLDGYGGLHPFGSAALPQGNAYWSGWDIARGVVLAQGSTAFSPRGWVMDGYGGLHPFGGAPSVSAGAYWPGWDIAIQVTEQ